MDLHSKFLIINCEIAYTNNNGVLNKYKAITKIPLKFL